MVLDRHVITTQLRPLKGGLVAEWLACWTQAQKGLGSNHSATLSGNSLRQSGHTNRASAHQAAKLVTALFGG